ncbi:MAG: hypothetical protein R2690_12300 [Acidimicrobiales bacterium]
MSNTAADRSETNVWRSPELARTYLAMADSVAHRTEGEAALLEVLPERVRAGARPRLRRWPARGHRARRAPTPAAWRSTSPR